MISSTVGVGVGVIVGVSVGGLVGVTVGVSLGVNVGVIVDVSVGVSLGVIVGVWVGVMVGVFVIVGVGVDVGLGPMGVFVGVYVNLGGAASPLLPGSNRSIARSKPPTFVQPVSLVLAISVILCSPDSVISNERYKSYPSIIHLSTSPRDSGVAVNSSSWLK